MTAYNDRNIYLICFLLSMLMHLGLNFGSFEIPDAVSEAKKPMKVFLSQCETEMPPMAEIPLEQPAEQVTEQIIEKPKTIRRQTDEIKTATQEVKTPYASAVIHETAQEQFMQTIENPAQVKETHLKEITEKPPVIKPEPPKKPVFDYAGYRTRLSDTLEAEKSYPYMARRKGLEGRVEVRAFINADGTLKAAEVEKSSGHGLLDNEALKLVTSVFPFERGSGEEFNILIPVRYSLEG